MPLFPCHSFLFPCIRNASFLGEKSRKSKRKPRIPASVSATYSSTVAEELLALLRKLHSLEAWNPLVNEFISAQLKSIVTMVTTVKPVQEEEVTEVWFFPRTRCIVYTVYHHLTLSSLCNVGVEVTCTLRFCSNCHAK